MNYSTHEVLTPSDVKEFIVFPTRLYKTNTSKWIRPWDKDIENVFEPKKNPAFGHGKCCRWLLKNEKGETVGRVAAFIDNKKKNLAVSQPTGGMGFFECIEEQTAAFALFDICKQWLQQQGIQAMDGPINFGNRDRWWGLLIEGFHLEPSYQANYNFPCYKDFFEAYGFTPLFRQITYGRSVVGAVQERLEKKADLLEQQGQAYKFAYLPKKEWNTLPDKICTVYNKAWANRKEIPEMSRAQAVRLVNMMKPILDERLLWFGYYYNEPIAFYLSIPDLNQIIKYLDGKFDWWAKIKFLWYSKTLKNKKAIGILFGVVPEHQGKGVDGAIIRAFQDMVKHRRRFPYIYTEVNWISDLNLKMIRVVEQINMVVLKKHVTYRKIF